MSFINDYPHTSIYDQDLGYLIRKYSQLYDSYGDLNEKYQKLIDVYEQIKGDLNNVTKDILEEWLNDGTLAQIINETIFNELNTKIDTLTARMDTISDELNKEFNDLRTQLITSINNKMLAFERKIEKENYINGTVDIINGYPVGVMSVLNPSSSRTLSAQGFCAVDVGTQIVCYCACITSDEKRTFIYQYVYTKSEYKWSYIGFKYFDDLLGHANDMCVYSKNGTIHILVATGKGNKQFVDLTSSNYNIKNFKGTVKTLNIPDNVPITSIARDGSALYFSYWPTVYKCDQDFNLTQTYELSSDTSDIVGQGIDVKNGILYKVRTAISKYNESFPSNAINNASFLIAIDLENDKILKTYRFNDVGECESVAILNGYIYYNKNGIGDGLRQCKMNGIFEYHFENSKFEPNRTPVSRRGVYFGHTYVGTSVYYDNSNINSNAYATTVGLGSSDKPYVSLIALNMAIRDIDSTSPRSITINLKGNGIKTPYDRTLVLTSLQSSIKVVGSGIENNIIGAISIRSCNRVRVFDLYIAPGDSYYTDNDFLNEFGTLSCQFSTVEIDTVRLSGGSNNVRPLFGLMSHLRIRGDSLYTNGTVTLDGCILAVNTKPTIGSNATTSISHTIGDSLT